MKPLTPEEAKELKIFSIPNEVISVFNDLLVEKLNTDGRATIYQDEALERIIQKTGVDRSTVFHKKWLDIESTYQAAGWRVTYDSPSYDEQFRAHWIFTRK